MRKALKYPFILFWLLLSEASVPAQEVEVKDYHYRYVTTELSPRQAIQAAIREALASCVQEHVGVRVMNLSQLEKQEAGTDYLERFHEFSRQISNGFIRKYRITDTIFRQQELTLEVSLTMDIFLYKPESDNDLGLNASAGKSVFADGESATITYSTGKPGYIYLFDLTYRNDYCLIHASESEIKPLEAYLFPTPGMIFELGMIKEEKATFEFGSFVILASQKPVSFGIRPVTENNRNIECVSFDQFFEIISAIKKDYSIVYLPYCIEENKK